MGRLTSLHGGTIRTTISPCPLVRPGQIVRLDSGAAGSFHNGFTDAKGMGMAKAQNPGAELAKLERQREALRSSAAALDAREKQLKKALAREGAERLAAAFAGLDLGEVSKAQAGQFAKAVQSLGFAAALVRLTGK
jgi:hypothetical protein